MRIIGLFKRIKSSLYFGLGFDRLRPEFIKYVWMHEMYILATCITMTFVNTLLMRVSADPDVTLKYNVVHFIFVGSSMILAAVLLHKLTNKTVITISVMLSMAVYLVVLVFMNQLGALYWLVAAVHGVATGLYWISYYNSLIAYSTDETRDVAINVIGILSGLVSLVMPLSSGFIIGAFAGFTGYYVLFGICFTMAAAAVWLTMRLQVERPDHEKTRFITLLKNIYTNKSWFFVIHMDFIRGIREGAFSFFLNVLLFSIVQNEGLVGVNSFVAGGVSMAAAMIAGRIVTPKNRIKLMLLSIALMAVFTLLLFIWLNTITVMLISLSSSFFGVFMNNPVATTTYTVLDRVPGARALKHETFGVTECYKNVGRILGVVFIMLMPGTNFYSILCLAILGITQFGTVLFAKLTLKSTEKYLPKENENA